MWPSPELQWQISAFALATLGAAWLLSALISSHRNTRLGNIIGGLGAGVAALGIAAALYPMPGVSAQEVLGMWTISLGMVFVATFLVSHNPTQLRWVFVACGVVCLLLIFWAIVLLFWIATVSPGGV